MQDARKEKKIKKGLTTKEMTMVDYIIMKHRDMYSWTRERLGISHYGMAWISFVKGLLFGLLIALLLN